VVIMLVTRKVDGGRLGILVGLGSEGKLGLLPHHLKVRGMYLTKVYCSRYTVKRNLGDHRLDLLSFSPPTDSGEEPWESVWHAQEYRFTGVSSETVARRI